jgi:hypothetical protein
VSTITPEQVVTLREHVAGTGQFVKALCDVTRAAAVDAGDEAAAYEAWSSGERALDLLAEILGNLDRVIARLKEQGKA